MPNPDTDDKAGKLVKTLTCRPLEKDGETEQLDGKAVHRRMRSIYLRIESGPDAGREIELSKDRVTGGRSSINDIVLSDTSVSGTHFELRLEGRGVRLKDLGSRNATFIGALRVHDAWLTPDTTFSPAGRCDIRLVAAMEAEVPISREHSFGDLYGSSAVMRELFLELNKLAKTPLPVLIEGETGTGKELVAKALHDHSPRKDQPFVVFDCTNLPRDLAESMILGYRRGAFTGASSDQAGQFECADGGTVFLDEIGELPLSLQPKLLRVLESAEVVRIGETKRRKVDVRFVAATHRDLRTMVAEGRFREDLYYRIADNAVRLPSLRERGNDVIDLARRFLAEACKEQGKVLDLADDARSWLLREHWPGNVRQLRNVMRRAAYLGTDTITSKDLARHWKSSNSHDTGTDALMGLPLQEAVRAFKHRYITHLLAHTNNNMTEAARLAGYTRQALRAIIREHERAGSRSLRDAEAANDAEAVYDEASPEDASFSGSNLRLD